MKERAKHEMPTRVERVGNQKELIGLKKGGSETSKKIESKERGRAHRMKKKAGV